MFNLDRFKMLCKERGVKQTALFAMVGKPRTYSSDLSKIKNVPMEYVRVWADALRTTPEYLMGETDDPAEGIKKEPTFAGGHSPEAIQFANEFSDLTQEDWHKLREYADFLKSRHTDK